MAGSRDDLPAHGCGGALNRFYLSDHQGKGYAYGQALEEKPHSNAFLLDEEEMPNA